eukprot:1177383-Prorocentrum_minimum.AAC.3
MVGERETLVYRETDERSDFTPWVIAIARRGGRTKKRNTPSDSTCNRRARLVEAEDLGETGGSALAEAGGQVLEIRGPLPPLHKGGELRLGELLHHVAVVQRLSKVRPGLAPLCTSITTTPPIG